MAKITVLHHKPLTALSTGSTRWPWWKPHWIIHDHAIKVHATKWVQQIYSKICIRRVSLYFKSRLSEWSTPIFSVCCSFDSTGFIKVVKGRWVDVSYFCEKIINCHCCLRGCEFKWNGSNFLSCHHKIFADDFMICDTLGGKSAGWTTPSNKSLCCISI